MKSTGNDIVALKVTDKQRTCHPTFYSKFITPAELALYKQPDLPFESFVWLLWSVKEAVYKYLKRNNTSLLFSPSKIVIQRFDVPYDQAIVTLKDKQWASGPQADAGFYTGVVLGDTQPLYFRSLIHDEFIASVVNGDNSFINVFWGIQQIDKDDRDSQSAAVRAFVLDKLTGLFSSDGLHIEKAPAGYPVIINGSREMNLPVSFAHHGNYVAYSFHFQK